MKILFLFLFLLPSWTLAVTSSIYRQSSGICMDDTCNLRPKPGFEFRYDSGNRFRVMFDASESVDPDGDIVKYEWDFGDGQMASEKIVFHTFTQTGIFKVKVRVTDNHGAYTSHIKHIQINKFMVKPINASVYENEVVILKVSGGELNSISPICNLDPKSTCEVFKINSDTLAINLGLVPPGNYTLGLKLEDEKFIFNVKVLEKVLIENPDSEILKLNAYFENAVNSLIANGASQALIQNVEESRNEISEQLDNLTISERAEVISIVFRNTPSYQEAIPEASKMYIDKSGTFEDINSQVYGTMVSTACKIYTIGATAVSFLVWNKLKKSNQFTNVARNSMLFGAAVLGTGAILCDKILSKVISEVRYLEGPVIAKRNKLEFVDGIRVEDKLFGVYTNINKNSFTYFSLLPDKIKEIILTVGFLGIAFDDMGLDEYVSLPKLSTVEPIKINSPVNGLYISEVIPVTDISDPYSDPIVIKPFNFEERNSLLLGNWVAKGNFELNVRYTNPGWGDLLLTYPSHISPNPGWWPNFTVYYGEEGYRYPSFCLEPQLTDCVWDFGDGTTGTGCSYETTHIYPSAGWYPFTLTATNSDGIRATKVVNLHILHDFHMEKLIGNCPSL